MRLLSLIFAGIQSINAQTTFTFTFDPVDPDNPSPDFVNDLIQNHLISTNGFVQFSSANFTEHKCFALFNNGLNAAPTWPDEGIIMSSGLPENIQGPNDSTSKSQGFGVQGDIDLDALSGFTTYDACVIEFEFSCPPETPEFSPQVNFNYVFASEEYLEFVDSGFNDAFAFILNDQNIALVPGTTTPVSIDTINDGTNSDYFVLNTGDNTQADGYTTLLTATGNPVAGTNTIKLAIADSKDSSYDSWVLLQAGTFSCIAPESFESPTERPTKNPTASPSKKPTVSPTKNPTSSPSKNPTESPTSSPTSLICETEEDLGQTCVHQSADPNANQHFNCCKQGSSKRVRCTTCGACQGEGSLLDGKNGIEQTCCTANGKPSKKVDATGNLIGDCVDGEYDHCCKIRQGGGRKDFVCFDDQVEVNNEEFCSGLADNQDAEPEVICGIIPKKVCQKKFGGICKWKGGACVDANDGLMASSSLAAVDGKEAAAREQVNSGYSVACNLALFLASSMMILYQ